MSGRYSEALDQQQATLRWLRGPVGSALIEAMGRQVEQIGAGKAWQIERSMLEPVESGVAYWWSPMMSGMLQQVASGFPGIVLQPELLPTRSGFWWFAAPLRGPHGWYPAISWALMDNAELIVVPWQQHPHRSTGVPDGILPWPIGEHSSTLANLRAPTDMPETPEDRETYAWLAPVIGAALALLDQRILTSAAHPADRATRRRLTDAYHGEATVRVVELRRAQRRPGQAHNEREVEWSCQWLVRGHWRQQPVGPKLSQVRPTWIAPYAKGPEDAPIRADATVFAVRR